MSNNDWEKLLTRFLTERYVKPSIPQILPPHLPIISSKKDLKSPLSKKWNPLFYTQLKRSITLSRSELFRSRIKDITNGLTMPDITTLSIGSAKRMTAAIMFFDIQDFTKACSENTHENMLLMLNIVIPVIMYIVKHWNGEIEKNTGDGIMAIFGTETRNDFLIARDVIESVMAIRYLMVNDVRSRLQQEKLPCLNFRIGIDMGKVLISRIGIKDNNSLTVVGDAANMASQLQQLARSNGICIGENIFMRLNPKLHSYCKQGKDSSWKWHYSNPYREYRFFYFDANWPEPKEWIKMRF